MIPVRFERGAWVETGEAQHWPKAVLNNGARWYFEQRPIAYVLLVYIRIFDVSIIYCTSKTPCPPRWKLYNNTIAIHIPSIFFVCAAIVRTTGGECRADTGITEVRMASGSRWIVFTLPSCASTTLPTGEI